MSGQREKDEQQWLPAKTALGLTLPKPIPSEFLFRAMKPHLLFVGLMKAAKERSKK